MFRSRIVCSAQATATKASTGRQPFYRAFSSWQQGLFAGTGTCCGIGIAVYACWGQLKDDVGNQAAAVAGGALGDHQLKDKAVGLSKDVVRTVLSDDESVRLLVRIVTKLLGEDESRLAVSLFLKSIFEDTYTQEITKKFVLNIVADDWVRGQLIDISKGLVEDLLRDPEIKALLTKFLLDSTEEALRDSHLHKTTGKAIRKITYETVNPF